MRELLTCCYVLMEIELRAQHTDRLFTLLHMAEMIDLLCRGGIIEERAGNHNVQWTKGEHGYFTGSVGSGGGSSFEKGGFVRLPNGTAQARLYSNGGVGSGGSSSGGVDSPKKRLQKMIDDGDVTLKINEIIQNRHYKGTKEYNEFLKNGVEKSYFTVSKTELQKILNEKSTTGSIRIDRAGVAREIFDCGKPVAYDTQLKVNTSFVKVHYSQKKTHLSPHTPDRRNE